MYNTTDKLNLPDIDREIAAYWEADNTFKKSVEERPTENSYVFYEGPPSANGKPGIHHVMGRTVKDLFCRYHTMLGQRVERKGGWDTHGLPVELSVEKELGITKEDIGTKITVDEYNQACRQTVMRYKGMWDDLTRKMGYWVDLEAPYITFENEYIESVWWLLKQLYDKDLVYKGYTIQPYSPAAGTGLSSHELNMPGAYKEVKDTTVVAMFKIREDKRWSFLFEGIDRGDLFVLAWTTTPWTLPSNTALAMGPKIDYVRVATFNPYTKEPINVILARELVGKWFKSEGETEDITSADPNAKILPWTITASFKGSRFELIEYEQLLPYQQPVDGDAFKILIGDHVTTSDGTGIVHTAPSFGADDKRIGDKYGFGSLTLVDKTGRFGPNVGEFSNRAIKNYDDDPDFVNVDVDIAVKLKKEGRAFNVAKYEHNYPHCWRTDKPVLYYPLDSWFVRSSKLKGRMAELNKTINWKPASTGEGRFGKWLENLQDWNLSRSRFWGIPLPIWRTDDGEEEICIGSMAELSQEIQRANEILGLNQEMPKDLHRPYIDDVVLVSRDGEWRMTRETDLIDVWFDSGSMPYAQWHYPFENKEKFEQNFPADFIAEGVDQTRGWFYTLHAIATMVFDSVAFKNVVSNGLVLAADGVKMSKRLGNTVDPFEAIEGHGADAIRWYMMVNSAPWDNLKFDLANGVTEVRNKFFGTLYNTYSFFALYANIDTFQYEQPRLPLEERPEIDRWIISLLHSLVRDVRIDLDDYEPTTATRRIQEFVIDNLSNWYVRLCRRRFWRGEYNADKISAYQTLYECLETIAKLMAPVSPFFAEWLYRNLNEESKRESAESVHLADFPTADETAIDAALEQRMGYAQRISSLTLSLRKKENLRVRQPLPKIMLPVLNAGFQHQVEQVADLIKAEVNVKEIEFLTDDSGVISKKIKPNFRVLGKKLGRNMKAAVAVFNQMTQQDIAQIERTGLYQLEIDGKTYDLANADWEITAEDIPGLLVASDGDLTVALDVTLTPELEAEGIARELVNRIQNLRKDKNLEVTDRIAVQLESSPLVAGAVERFGDYIREEVLATELTLAEGVSVDTLDLPEGSVGVSLSVV